MTMPNIYRKVFWILILSCVTIQRCFGDFVFKDFNETTGIIFNGIAGTTNCYNYTSNNYGDVQGKADIFNENVVNEISENTQVITESMVETNIEIYNQEITSSLAGFLNRNDTISAPKKCSVRARLTPSNPSKVGSIWFREKAPVSNGFDTYFTFQISDHSKECVLVKDQYFSTIQYRSCSIHGGDGFAFVIHNDPSTTAALGSNGGQMGFGGILNSIAIAFDTWTNPGSDTMLVDHVSIQSKGHGANDALQPGLLGLPRYHPLADGQIHLVRIAYFGDLRPEYFNRLVASDTLLPFLKDNGEQKRVGTLVVFLDDGVASNDPLLAIPINLSLVLDLPDDKAYIGFTSSTGRFYEKHDLLSWVWCDQEPCQTPEKSEFDYHQTSKFSSTVLRQFVPGDGFGSGGGEGGFPTKNESPDTSPWELPVQHFSESRNIGLAADAQSQVPPNTLY